MKTDVRRPRARVVLVGLAATFEFLGIWTLAYLSLLVPALILILIGLLLLTTLLVKHPSRTSEHVVSNWIFDRPEKRKWEDVDCILRR